MQLEVQLQEGVPHVVAVLYRLRQGRQEHSLRLQATSSSADLCVGARWS